jgi:type I restriction enzyme M protein
VLGSVDLPREMFAKSDTHTMTSILILQKFTAEERRIVQQIGRLPDYDIFMAIADRVGWDLRGQPVYLRTPEGEEILRKVLRNTTGRNAKGDLLESVREVEEAIIDDHLPAIAELFEDWLNETSPRWLQQ